MRIQRIVDGVSHRGRIKVPGPTILPRWKSFNLFPGENALYGQSKNPAGFMDVIKDLKSSDG